LVQMEHWALTSLFEEIKKATNSIVIHLFIIVPFGKDTISDQFQVILIKVRFKENCYMFNCF
jgi:hypothetical protein